MSQTIATAKELCRYYMKANIPLFIHGAPGIGKSDLFYDLSKEEKIGFIDLRLGMMDPVDLLGLPIVDTKTGDTTWARPAFWPDEKRDGVKGILLFDEMADASRSMQSAAYQIILNGRAGPHILPKGWYRCAAGNRREDRAAAQTISSALANRFAHLDIEADPQAWTEWATQKGIDPKIIGFIRFRTPLLHAMTSPDLRAFPTPRSWARVNEVVNAPDKVRDQLIAGLVGADAAGEFNAYLRALDLPSIEDVVKDPKHCRIPSEPSHRYALASMLARFAERDNLPAIGNYIKREEFGREFEILTILDATKRDPELCKTKSFVDWANRNKDLHL